MSEAAVLDAAVATLTFVGLAFALYFVGCYLSDVVAERVFGRYK